MIHLIITNCNECLCQYTTACNAVGFHKSVEGLKASFLREKTIREKEGTHTVRRGRGKTVFAVERLSPLRLWVKGDFRCTVNSDRSCTGAQGRLRFHNQTGTTSSSSLVASPKAFSPLLPFRGPPRSAPPAHKAHATQAAWLDWFPGDIAWNVTPPPML